MQGEARLVSILDQCRARGWVFEPNPNGTWTVHAPKWITDQYPAGKEPVRWCQGLVETLAYAQGVEQAIEWVKFQEANGDEDVS